jgi:hypothetical protein
MTEQFDDRLLDEFAHQFYGYGNYGGKFWFIGMEEGGGNSFAEISRRLDAWAHGGRCELEDLPGYHAAIGITYLFNDRPRLQPTWSELIRIVLTAQGQSCDTESIRDYQKRRLGTMGGDTCLLELLPLPSPSTNAWLYRDNSSLPYLTDREAYRAYTTSLRVAHLQDRLSHYQPTAVVLYGLQYQVYWKQIAGVQTWLESPEGIVYASKDQTLFVLAKHPAARGVTNEYFNQIGRLVAAKGCHGPG